MQLSVNTAYDPETIQLLTAALDDAWHSLLPGQQAKTDKSALAERLLIAAAGGERDPIRLREYALGNR
jgi:hypothetical protein